jgi:hypothetical protein
VIGWSSGRKVLPFAFPGGICASSERLKGKRSEAQRRRESAKPLGGTIPAGRPWGVTGDRDPPQMVGCPKSSQSRGKTK